MEEQHLPFVLGEWLKHRRKALDLTQEEFVRRVGCSLGALRKIESGDRKPSKQLAALIAKALDLSDEDQTIFIRVARGELNLERLREPSQKPYPPIPDIAALRLAQKVESPPFSVHPPSGHIPYQATPLIGREIELAALERMFKDPQCRLLTLTGVGGIGKTRLAIDFARHNLSMFPGGVFYIPLAPINSPEKIAPAIADVLDLRFSGPNDPKEQLFAYLEKMIKQDALFILDNLEHLLLKGPPEGDISGLLALVCEALERLPNIKILTTSRERLNLRGEWTFELHGLSVPPLDYAEQLNEYKSLELFVNCAQRLRADFSVTDENRTALVQICQMVEGVPLAIELAAAWAGLLSCHEISQEIQHNMDFLSTSMHDVPQRHRSIRATFDHSWKLLSEEERTALCQLSVFQGGFDRKAAFQVAGASLPLLASLSDKSLVRCKDKGRYDLHEVIRLYAMDHLNDKPCFLEAYERHSEYYLKLLSTCETSLKNASQQETVRQLTGEIDNIRMAWQWGIKHKKFDQLGLAGRAFGWYFEIAGLYREGIEQFEYLLQSLQAEKQSCQCDRLIGLAFLHQALLYFRKGEFDPARKKYEESITTLRSAGDQLLLADALIYLGIILHLNGEYGQSKISVEEGLGYARDCDSPWLEALAIDNLGYIDSLMGRYAEGYAKMKVGIAIWRRLGDPHSIAMGLNFLVPTLIKLGQYEEAKKCMQESIALCEQSQNRWGMGTAYSYLGLACMAAGEYEVAKMHLLKSLEIFSDYITGWNIARSLAYLGHATRLAGDCTEARKYYLDALRVSLESEAVPIALDALSGLGSLLAQAGQVENALFICYFISNHPSSEEETKTRADQICLVLEPKLTSAEITAIRSTAAEKSLDDIMKIV